VTSEPTKSAAPTTATDEAVTAGRGVLFIAAAKMYFMLAGAAIELVLPRVLGWVVFGAYGVVAQVVSTVNNVVTTGTIQAVSRFTTADPAKADEAKATGLRMHLFVGLPLAAGFALLAPWWAELLHDPSKTLPFALSAGIVLGYAFYAVFVGSANGTRAFHKQAGLDASFATLKAGFILCAAALGLGVVGAISGWVLAVLVILVVAMAWVGLPRRQDRGAALDVRPMARFLGQVAAYLILMNLLMAVDQFLLKRLTTEWFTAHDVAAAEAARQADRLVGYYRGAQNLARLPYQLILAATFVVFPLVSRATFEADLEKTRGYIRTTLRYSLLCAGALGSVLVANPGPILDVPYKADAVLVCAPALVALALGHVAFAVLAIAGTILNGAGRTKDAIGVAMATLALAVVGLWGVIPRMDPTADRQVLFACALAISAAMGLGALLSAVVLWRRFAAAVPVLSVLRVAVAMAVAAGLGRVVPATGVVLALAEAALCGLAFLFVLVLSGELGATDRAVVLRVLRRRS
jgi:O-antigen/teichoic acid export membrane protein